MRNSHKYVDKCHTFLTRRSSTENGKRAVAHTPVNFILLYCQTHYQDCYVVIIKRSPRNVEKKLFLGVFFISVILYTSSIVSSIYQISIRILVNWSRRLVSGLIVSGLIILQGFLDNSEKKAAWN